MSIAYSTCAIYHAQQYPHKNPISAPARRFLTFPSAASERMNVRKWGNISINIVLSDVSLYTSQFRLEFRRQCEYPRRCRACKRLSLASLPGSDRDRSVGSDAGDVLNDEKAPRKQDKPLGLVVWTQPQQFWFCVFTVQDRKKLQLFLLPSVWRSRFWLFNPLLLLTRTDFHPPLLPQFSSDCDSTEIHTHNAQLQGEKEFFPVLTSNKKSHVGTVPLEKKHNSSPVTLITGPMCWFKLYVLHHFPSHFLLYWWFWNLFCNPQ